jgi:LAGLIDADG-like domain
MAVQQFIELKREINKYQFVQHIVMHIQKEFLNRLEMDGYTKKDIRFFVDGNKLKTALSKTSINKYCIENNINRGSLYQMMSGKRPVPLEILEDLQLNFDAPCMITGSNVAIQIPKKLTQELCYLIGALRDGTVVREMNGEYLCAFYSKYKDFVRILQMLVTDVFHKEPRIEKFKDVYGIRIRALTLYLFFQKIFEVPQRQCYWATPKIIENASLEMQKAYISGFWDAEGSCPRTERLDRIKTKNMWIGFVQKNKESLEFIKRILEENNIQCGNVYWSTDKFVLKIRPNSIKKFSEFIGSKHPTKSRRLKEVVKIFSMDSKQPRVLEFTD